MSAVALNRASKLVLVASTFLTAYALLAVIGTHVMHHPHGPHHPQSGPEEPRAMPAEQGAAIARDQGPAYGGLARGEGHHHHDHHHHGPRGDAEHPEGPHNHGPHHKHCPASMLAHIALLAGISGIASGFKPKSRRVLCYMAMLFAFELAAVFVVLTGEVRAVRWCQQSAMMVPVQVSVVQAQVNNVNVLIAEENVGKPFKNEVYARECTHRVVHVATIACVILGVVVGAFIACASRLLRETREFERQAASAAQGVVVSAIPAAEQQQAVVYAIVASSDEAAIDEEKKALRTQQEMI